MDPKTIIENLGVLSFNEEKIPEIKKGVSFLEGAFSFVFFIIFLILFLPSKQISGMMLIKNTALLFIGFSVAILASYYVAKILRTPVSLKRYIQTSFGIMFFFTIVVGILFLLTIIGINFMPGLRSPLSFLTFLVPFYAILSFAWSCEMASEIKSGQSVFIAGVALIFSAATVMLALMV